ncbi:MAG: asparaginase [Burkholderiaceae bacterium]
MNAEPLVVTSREVASEFRSMTGQEGADHASRAISGGIENVHHGSIAVVSVGGALMHFAGDPDYLTFTRSTLKPLQVLPFVGEGGPAHFGWGSREVALMCASHSGEGMHTEIVAGMLETSGNDESQLRCGCHVPGWYAALDRTPPEGAKFTAIQHNCSGKHAGFLASCRLHGEPVEDYLDPTSPVQRRVVSAVAQMTGLAESALATGTDGCSAPNYAMPLSRLALAFARIAQGKSAGREVGAMRDALGVVFDAMTGHPELVSGTARSDQALMSFAPGDWVTKIGADGAQAIGIRTAGIGIAIKIADGNRDALYSAVIETLRQIGLFSGTVDDPGNAFDGASDGVPKSLARWRGPTLRNARGLTTGRMSARFKLRAA